MFLGTQSYLPACKLVAPLLMPPRAMFSMQIIANHHMQSISFASGGDMVSHAHPSGDRECLWLS